MVHLLHFFFLFFFSLYFFFICLVDTFLRLLALLLHLLLLRFLLLLVKFVKMEFELAYEVSHHLLLLRGILLVHYIASFTFRRLYNLQEMLCLIHAVLEVLVLLKLLFFLLYHPRFVFVRRVLSCLLCLLDVVVKVVIVMRQLVDEAQTRRLQILSVAQGFGFRICTHSIFRLPKVNFHGLIVLLTYSEFLHFAFVWSLGVGAYFIFFVAGGAGPTLKIIDSSLFENVFIFRRGVGVHRWLF